MSIDFTRFPKKVEITDVTLRDGFQNENVILSTSQKLEIVLDLIGAGVKNIEVTSFVKPELVPQLSDASDLFKILPRSYPVKFRALVPNIKGYEKALEAGCRHMVLFVSADEKHNKANISQGIEETLQSFQEMIEMAKRDEVRVSIAVSMAFERDLNRLPDILELSRNEHVTGWIFCDTSGSATPLLVSKRVQLFERYASLSEIAFHFHDTMGCGIANILTTLSFGYYKFDATLGGIGGCPFAPGAAGNVSLEDTTWFLHSMGIETRINPAKLFDVHKKLSQFLGHTLVDSKVARFFLNSCNARRLP